MFCTNCGSENTESAKFCTSCGQPLNVVAEENNISTININNEQVKTLIDDDYEKQMLQAFIGNPNKVAYYDKAFKKFESSGYQKNWSWWGFFGTIFFLIHRKVYNYAIALMLLSFVSALFMQNMPSVQLGLNISIMMIGGMMSPFLIFNRYKKLKFEIESKETDSKKCIELMTKKGGVVSLWKIILVLIVYILLFIGLDMSVNPNNYSNESTLESTSKSNDPIKINHLEVYYTNAVTKDEASTLASYLAKLNYGIETEATVQLNKEDGIYQCRMFILPTYIDNPEFISTMQTGTQELSRDVFNGSPVDIHFCDDQMNTKRIVSFKNNN